MKKAMVLIFLPLFCLVLGCGVKGTGASRDKAGNAAKDHDAVAYYSQMLAEKLTRDFAYSNPRVVFGYFVLEGNRTNFLGERVYQLFSDYFSQKYGRSVLICDRRKMSEVLEELNLQQGRIFDSSTIAEIGKFVGANLMVTGKITRLGATQVSLSAQMTEIETSVNLSYATTPYFSVPEEYLEKLDIVRLNHPDISIPLDYLTHGYSPYLNHISRGDLYLERGQYQQALYEFEMAIRHHKKPFLGYLGKCAVHISILKAMLDHAKSSEKGISLNRKKVINVYQKEILSNIKKATRLLETGKVPIEQQGDGRFYLNNIVESNYNVQKQLLSYYRN